MMAFSLCCFMEVMLGDMRMHIGGLIVSRMLGQPCKGI